MQSSRFPLLTRNDYDARHPLIRQTTESVPTGYSFAPGNLCPMDGLLPGPEQMDKLLQHFRLRVDDFSKLQQGQDAAGQSRSVGISGVYFPLLATIIPRWLQALRESRAQDAWKIVYLVSGVGVPRDESADPGQNSTEGVSELLEMWLLTHYPGITVRRVHSDTNLFRYDENIAFVKRELLPEIEPIRDALACKLGSAWRDNFKLTVSFASGSPARITAIQSALRPYRPMFMHMWQLKTFWHESTICLDDIEFMSSEDVETLPAVPTEQTDPHVQLVAQRIKELKQQFDAVVTGSGGAQASSPLRQFFPDTSSSDGPVLCSPVGHDMAKFWHRKSRKVVLSVLLVLKEGETQPRLYAGTNMEVSMPTGSLCAERNAIGSALAADLSLKRSELKLIGVLGLVLPKERKAEAVRPTKKSTRDSDTALLPIPLDDRAPASAPLVSSSSGFSLYLADGEREEKKNALQVDIPDAKSGDQSTLSPPRFKTLRSFERGDSANSGLPSELALPPTKASAFPYGNLRNSTSTGTLSQAARSTERAGSSDPLGSHPGTPAMLSRKLQVEMEDMNPLKPCGACSEWLKKIAEVNPAFRILTFTDANCTGTYIESVMEA